MSNLLIGKKAIIDAIKNNSIVKVYTSPKNKDVIDLSNKNNVYCKIKDDVFFNNQFKNVNHQFCCGETYKTKNMTLEEVFDSDDRELIVILDEINDPFNFGSIIRSCECQGIKNIIYKKNNQCQINNHVIKSSCGAINNVNLIQVINIRQTIDKLKENNYWIYATALNQKSESLKNINWSNKSAIIIGNEEKGVSKLLIENSDFIVHINMVGKTQSLNAAMTTAIICFDWLSKK